ncbi:MAG: urease accessory protein UreH domain-containing protein [Patescibacteria group bacterium]
MKTTIKIKGMHCNSCSRLIEDDLKDRVDSVSASYSKGEAKVDFNESKISQKEIEEKIKKLGYEIETESQKKSSFPLAWIAVGLVAIIVLYSLFIGFDFSMSAIRTPVAGESLNLLLLFIVGLLTGFHCISMCGGFIVSYTTKNALNGHKNFTQHLVYGTAKVFSYALIGGLLGLLGGFVAFNSQVRGLIAILAGIFMVFYALSMFGLKYFRRFQFNPKFLRRAVSTNRPQGPYIGPLVTGLLTGLFIACGPLQAMYLYAIGSGSFSKGALSLAVFGIGTLPVLLGFGSLVTFISHKTTAKILKISALLVLILGLIMINTGLALTGSSYDLGSLRSRLIGSNNNSIVTNGVQEIKMTINGTNWSPKVFVLKKGVPVKWTIEAIKLPCATEIYVDDYKLDIKLKTGTNVIEFTPDKAGTVKWACWMGMISGNFIVTDTGQASDNDIKAAAPTCVGMCQN